MQPPGISTDIVTHAAARVAQASLRLRAGAGYRAVSRFGAATHHELRDGARVLATEVPASAIEPTGRKRRAQRADPTSNLGIRVSSTSPRARQKDPMGQPGGALLGVRCRAETYCKVGGRATGGSDAARVLRARDEDAGWPRPPLAQVGPSSALAVERLGSVQVCLGEQSFGPPVVATGGLCVPARRARDSVRADAECARAEVCMWVAVNTR